MVNFDKFNPSNLTYCSTSLLILKVSRVLCLISMVQLVLFSSYICLGDYYASVFFTEKELSCQSKLSSFDNKELVKEYITFVIERLYVLDKLFCQALICCIIFDETSIVEEFSSTVFRRPQSRQKTMQYNSGFHQHR